MVAEYFNGQNQPWFWKWKKRNLNVIETAEFTNLNNLLRQVELSDVRDNWVWLGDPSGTFTVASMKTTLFKVYGHSGSFVLPWNNWVPKKLNIFMWKATMDRLATKEALSFRNIHVGSIGCDLCGEGVETSCHLFTSCPLAMAIWNAISSWCQTPPIYAHSIRDLLNLHTTTLLCYKKKK
ncbi:uncharacterized protein LOC143573753, partial [Bidens hawaiensis]|uniref:uncharacterized protein LOC143573753 n=1 Tax=Bidens hawaiensis TaxID=980011 RepID=UPI004049A29B